MLGRTGTFVKSLNTNIILWVVIMLLVLLGIHNRFIQDDAFISFRYAEHLAEGHGLTWNIGEEKPVEGYTNFLWVLFISPIEVFNLDPVFWSMLLSILLGVGTLFITYKLSVIILGGVHYGLLPVILLGTNYTFSCYMTGGLETQLQTFLVVFAAYGSFRIANHDNYSGGIWPALVSVVFSLAVMTRLDSVLICTALYFYILFTWLENEKFILKENTSNLVFLTLPGLIVVGVWLGVKYLYYGSILPNTFYVKGGMFLNTGLIYIGSFLYEYSFPIVMLLAIFYFKEILKKSNLRILLLLISLWSVYILIIGGDFMEYRFFVPILPFIFIFISSVFQLMNHSKVQASIILLLIIASFYHAVFFKGNTMMESISSLHGHIVNENEDWKGVGVTLGEMFSKSGKPVTIATTACGAIPYYSKLPTIDMLGLNDRWIAKSGAVLNLSRPGHTRFATVEYLLESNVNLVIGHPVVKPMYSPLSANLDTFFWLPVDLSKLPDTSKIVEIPLKSGNKIDVLYFKRHFFIDEKIEELKLRTYEIKRYKRKMG